MVHALHGIRRVLARPGTLVDLRPLSSRCPIDVVSADAVAHVGEVDATGMVADDAAADAAVLEAVNQGWFVPLREHRFDFAFYWDSVAEMFSFLEASTRMRQVVPSFADLERLYRGLSARHGAGARLRCRRPMRLAVYEKAQ